MAESLETASPALIRKLCEGLKRQFVLGPKLGYDMTRDATIARTLATIHPHPDVGKPRLWSLGEKDGAVRALPWPIQRADEIAASAALADAAAGSPDNVVRLR